MKNISLKYESSKNNSEVRESIKNEIENSGFKVLNELNLSEKIRQTLKIDFDDYIILEVCNPKFAQEILAQDKSAGLFLPCKIAVYSDDSITKIELLKPTITSDYFYNKHIESVTDKIETILDEIIKKSL